MEANIYKEFQVSSPQEYSEFGKPLAQYPIDLDPTSSCLSGSLWHNGELANLGQCAGFMSSKCSQNWDSGCDLYLSGLTDIDLLRDFLQQTASKKYCRLADNSKCSINCEPFNPIDQVSPQVCNYYGNDPLVDSNQTIDIGYYTPVNISPVYF